MRLQQFINEDINTDMFLDLTRLIFTKCKPYLNNMKKRPEITRLFSGMDSYKNVDTIQIKKNRAPKDTPLALHRDFDDLFYKKFGWKARSEAAFCTTNSMYISSTFGKSYVFFPIGNFKVLYHKHISDLLEVLEELEIVDYTTELMIDDMVFLKERLFDVVKEYKQETNTISADILKRPVELMFKCSAYYLVNEKVYNSIYKELFI